MAQQCWGLIPASCCRARQAAAQLAVSCTQLGCLPAMRVLPLLCCATVGSPCLGSSLQTAALTLLCTEPACPASRAWLQQRQKLPGSGPQGALRRVLNAWLPCLHSLAAPPCRRRRFPPWPTACSAWLMHTPRVRTAGQRRCMAGLACTRPSVYPRMCTAEGCLQLAHCLAHLTT